MLLNHEDVQAVLLDYMRGLLDEKMAQAVRTHIESCPECSAAVLELAPITGLYEALCFNEIKVPGLNAQKILELASDSTDVKRERRQPLFMRGSFMGALALAACVLLVLGILNRPAEQTYTITFAITENIAPGTRGSGMLSDPLHFKVTLPSQHLLAVAQSPNQKNVHLLLEDIEQALLPRDRKAYLARAQKFIRKPSDTSEQKRMVHVSMEQELEKKLTVSDLMMREIIVAVSYDIEKGLRLELGDK